MLRRSMADAPAPSPTDETPRRKRIVLLSIVAAITLGLDLWTKAWAWQTLREGKTVTVIKDWAYFEFGFNTGSAFSFLRDASYARLVFIVVTILALAYMVKLARTLPTKWASAYVAIALVSGGALGNLHDRLVRVMDVRGEDRYGVVDFIKVYYWPNQPWPTFNVADIALVFGVGLLFIFLTRHGDAIDAAKAAAAKAAAAPSKPAEPAPPKPIEDARADADE